MYNTKTNVITIYSILTCTVNKTDFFNSCNLNDFCNYTYAYSEFQASNMCEASP